MYSAPQLAIKYTRYYATALNGKGHGMHSPFVYDFIRNVLNDFSGIGAPAKIEQLRASLLRNKTQLQIEDLGAGSRSGATKQRTVAQLARTAVKPRKYGQVLHRLAKHYRVHTAIELGTSLGLTTAYLHEAGVRTLHSVEGSQAVHETAARNLKALGITGPQLHVGNFDMVLPRLLQSISSIDLGFIDGNHRYEPTLRYFHQMLDHCGNDSVLVFDDIHWSREMEEAWEAIRSHPRVRCTVDIFFLGFVFFRDEFKVPRHFTVRF
ncbi:MAG: class I SAM-dependent methyltransferase [Chitinophagaceae bacterium]|nr:MAG: class I SAM-dependent methyltransferase [Chitinophagaceae bacterium]